MKKLITLKLIALILFASLTATAGIFQEGYIVDEAGDAVELLLYNDGTFMTTNKAGESVHYKVSIVGLNLDPETQRVLGFIWAPNWTYTAFGWVYALKGPVSGWQYVDSIGKWVFISPNQN